MEMTVSVVVIEVAALLWTWYNYSKVVAIMHVCRPRASIGADGRLKHSAPSLYDAQPHERHGHGHFKRLLAITKVLATLTRSHGPSQHAHHHLFGSAGVNGPEMLLFSIKINTWLLITGSTFCFNTMLSADITAMLKGTAGTAAWNETLVYGGMGISFILLLIFVIPATFTLYTLVTSIEGFKKDWAIEKVLGSGRPAHHHAAH